ncbi:hypothetical protein C8Q79DRAFT_1012482 [Trametes meyenii]|nr:hypothetical protein C8Q79DRAFT_1012482 [Trametes meyenii]
MGDAWTFTIDDSSSIITYTPQGDGGIGDWTSTGWQPFYTGAGGFTSRGGEPAFGNSTHITAFPGAGFSFEFYGTALSLHGTAECAYDVSIDGSSSSFQPKNGQLFSQDKLSEKRHTVSLTAHASTRSTFTFDYADVTRAIPLGVSLPTPTVHQATETSFIKYDGNWNAMKDPLIPNQQNPAPFYRVDNGTASLSFSFQGVGVAINGTRNWGSFTYDVTLDNERTGYNASTMWFIGDTLLYYQDGLDPQATHTLNLTPKVDEGFKFWLNTVTVFTDNSTVVAPTDTGSSGSTPSTSSSKKTNVGVIVGPIIGVLAFLAILGGLFFWWRRRRQEDAAARAMEEASAFPPMVAPAPLDTSTSTLRDYKNASGSPGAIAGGNASLSHFSPSTTEASESLSGAPLLHYPGPHHPTLPGLPAAAGGVQSPVENPAAAVSPVSTGVHDPNAAVDQIIQILAQRMGGAAPVGARSEYGGTTDGPPPEYGA